MPLPACAPARGEVVPEPIADLDLLRMRRTATKVSVLDVLEAEGAVQPRTVWHRLCRREPVWVARATPHQFAMGRMRRSSRR